MLHLESEEPQGSSKQYTNLRGQKGEKLGFQFLPKWTVAAHFTNFSGYVYLLGHKKHGKMASLYELYESVPL